MTSSAQAPSCWQTNIVAPDSSEDFIATNAGAVYVFVEPLAPDFDPPRLERATSSAAMA
jgi:hypothetical protein